MSCRDSITGETSCSCPEGYKPKIEDAECVACCKENDVTSTTYEFDIALTEECVKPFASEDIYIERLSSPDPAIRSLAAESLGKFESEKAVDVLIRTLTRKPGFCQ
jgi:hypothetical protein